jgi:hypothetical protein
VYRASVGKFTYYGKTLKEITDNLAIVISEMQDKQKSDSYSAVGSRLRKVGFQSIGWKRSKYPCFRGWFGHGIVLVSCDFKSVDSLVVSRGNLRLLLASIGQVDANRQWDRHATRSIILCHREFGPKGAIELIEESGIEFMTTDELIDSLGPGKITEAAS